MNPARRPDAPLGAQTGRLPLGLRTLPAGHPFPPCALASLARAHLTLGAAYRVGGLS
jgi:hypothetical protein